MNQITVVININVESFKIICSFIVSSYNPNIVSCLLLIYFDKMKTEGRYQLHLHIHFIIIFAFVFQRFNYFFYFCCSNAFNSNVWCRLFWSFTIDLRSSTYLSFHYLIYKNWNWVTRYIGSGYIIYIKSIDQMTYTSNFTILQQSLLKQFKTKVFSTISLYKNFKTTENNKFLGRETVRLLWRHTKFHNVSIIPTLSSHVFIS